VEPIRIGRPDRGVLFVISGPSGVGKSTLVRALLSAVPDLAFSVSATTRPPRAGESDGVHYHFLDEPSFLSRVDAGHFLEHAVVYGSRYGTLREPTEAVLAEGRSVLLDIDAQGAAQVRASMPEAVSIFLLPPDRASIEARLRARGTDGEEVIQRRLRDMDGQLAAVGDYDYLVVNDHLVSAEATLIGVVLAELSRTCRRGSLVRRWEPTRA
jgi:guanylate kinase